MVRGAGTHLESLSAWPSWQNRGVLGLGKPPMMPMSTTLQGAQHPVLLGQEDAPITGSAGSAGGSGVSVGHCGDRPG